MSPKHIFKTMIISIIVATVLLAIGVFVIQGFATPSGGLRYNLVEKMFSDSEWVAFHFKAWLWLFVSAAASGLVTARFLKASV